ncbi:MAG: GntR family transcriptional regulator [Mycetocola sp.]
MSTPHSRLPWERLGERSPIATRMAAHAAKAIVERRHPEGALITEAELAAESGASRTPAREAMVQLESWGLVRLVPKKGAIVTTITSEERRDLLAVRALFETAAVGSPAIAGVAQDTPSRGEAPGTTPATPGATSTLADDLAQILDRQEQALAAHDLLDFASADYAFHSRLIQASGNRVTMDILDRLGPRLARLTYQVITEHPDRIGEFLTDHRDLAELLARGDHDRFTELVHHHITTGHFPAGAPTS